MSIKEIVVLVAVGLHQKQFNLVFHSVCSTLGNSIIYLQKTGKTIKIVTAEEGCLFQGTRDRYSQSVIIQTKSLYLQKIRKLGKKNQMVFF